HSGPRARRRGPTRPGETFDHPLIERSPIMHTPLWLWLAVIAFIVVMLAIDLVAHRKAHVIGVREAAVWSAVWIALGVGFGAIVWAVWGADLGQQYFAGYLIEKSLAVDNVFVWAIIFAHFA